MTQRTKVKGFQPIEAMQMNWIGSHLSLWHGREHKLETLMINFAAEIEKHEGDSKVLQRNWGYVKKSTSLH